MASPKLRTGAVRNWDENNFWNGLARLQWTLRGHWERPCFSDWSCFGADLATTMKPYWCCNARKNPFSPCWARLQGAIHSAGCGRVLRKASPNLRCSFGLRAGAPRSPTDSDRHHAPDRLVHQPIRQKRGRLAPSPFTVGGGTKCLSPRKRPVRLRRCPQRGSQQHQIFDQKLSGITQYRETWAVQIFLHIFSARPAQ